MKDGKTQNSKTVASYDIDKMEIYIEECTPTSMTIGLNDNMMDGQTY